eukprot:TRINITY_DN71965_c0_g2_i1.p1 TRINITY_DN71965_c0_g2~~TRINITY_DN71965_c0_g2_i1.p1  ORF type:complete len:311 (-),score=50.82 TRINITY_DN71965_c0_g2_i1:153-1085(-)
MSDIERHRLKTITIATPKKCKFCFKKMMWVKAKQCTSCKKIFHSDCVKLAEKYEKCELTFDFKFSNVVKDNNYSHSDSKIIPRINNNKKWLKAAPSQINLDHEIRASLSYENVKRRSRIMTVKDKMNEKPSENTPEDYKLKREKEENNKIVGNKISNVTMINQTEVEIDNNQSEEKMEEEEEVEVEVEELEEDNNHLRIPTLEKGISSLYFPMIKNEENKKCENPLTSNFEKLYDMGSKVSSNRISLKNSNSDLLEKIYQQIQLNQKYNTPPFINVPKQQQQRYQQQEFQQNNPNEFIFKKKLYQIKSSG